MRGGSVYVVEVTPKKSGWLSLIWLIANIRVYLTGSLKSRNRPKTRKYSQKCARITHELRAFTLFALNMIEGYANYTIR
jgi:hypothetical protein